MGADLFVCRHCGYLTACEDYGINLFNLLLPGSLFEEISGNFKRRKARNNCPSCNKRSIIRGWTGEGRKRLEALSAIEDARTKIVSAVKSSDLKWDWDMPSAWLSLAGRQEMRGCDSLALLFAHQATEQAPKSGEAWLRSGIILERMKRYAEAKESLERALSLGQQSAVRRLRRIAERNVT
jgi:tetratricopeptide (TPR) repeat protein